MQLLSSSDFRKTEVEIVEQLKKKIKEMTSKNEKLAFLTILPISWSRQKDQSWQSANISRMI